MALIADGLLLMSALAAAFYCRVLALRLRRLGDTDKGLGGAISTLNLQVSDMKAALAEVATAAGQRSGDLERLTKRADTAARRLELLLAAIHDVEEGAETETPKPTTLHLDMIDRVTPVKSPRPVRASRVLVRNPRRQGAT